MLLKNPINLNNPAWNTPIDSYNVGNPVPMQQMQGQPSAPFVWGQGGARLTPDQLSAEQKIAQSLLQPDYSPVQHWAQGAARLGGNVAGALDMGRLNKQSRANQVESASVAQLLAGASPSTDAVAQALANPYIDESVKTLAGKVWDRQNPKPVAPHYFQDNAGNEWSVGSDGKPVLVHYDSSPKQNFIPDGMGGGQFVSVPNMVPNPTTGSVSPFQSHPAIGAVLPDPRKGGGDGNVTSPFRR